jgi:four helix bundle protein
MEIIEKKQYDLEARTLSFTKKVIDYIDDISKDLVNVEISRQLIRSAGSIGANYIEANESLGKKDFVMRIKICRKEAKETRYWLSLLRGRQLEKQNELIREVTELMKIFGAILEKSK